MQYTHVRVAPTPTCPKCGKPMVLRLPRSGQEFYPFWSCSQWPICDGTRRTERKDDLMPWDSLDVWKEVRIWV